jgi:hydroxypyruvate reductase
MDARRLLLELFDGALRAVDGHACVGNSLRGVGGGPVELFAAGKAASSMTSGAYAALGDRVRRALVITRDGHVGADVGRLQGALVIESAHPVPDERSLAAGAELERRIAELPVDVHPVFLVSGGASSLVESLQPGVSLDELRALNTRGLAAGWDIGRLNRERTRLSRLKGGGVARLLSGRDAHALFISDVPGDDPGVIGSGLLGRSDGIDDRVSRIVVANIAVACERVASMAATHGLEAEVRAGRFAGDASDVAHAFVEALRQTRADVLVWGGESTVALPERAGRGGRNQHLALTAALALRMNEPLTVLAAGTDGTDGVTDDAGAVIDAGTVTRAELAGVDVQRAWREFDAALALEAAEDLVHTGPTGTNVGDILIGIRRNRARVRDLASPRVV